MPVVNIQVTREGTLPGETRTTPAQKAALIKGVTDLLSEVLFKPPHLTHVIIEEIELDDWGTSGLPVSELRKQAAKPD
ncbi:MAG: 4-oxalocrotonate tautomerase family protein [Caulobacter sp.]|nr:4-oxalocrotonate tautomerase family protein [Caulobacter sp.]